MKVVILAGGLGTRLAEETDKLPKPMVEVGGLPILWHIMKGYEAFGYTEFVVACGYKAPVIKRFFADYWREHAGNVLVNTRTGDMENITRVSENWDVHCVDTGLTAMTGDRVLALKDIIGDDEDFMLTYGDGVSDVNLGELVATHRVSNALVTLTAARPKGRFGSLELDIGHGACVVAGVSAFKEKLAEGWVNAGFMVMNRKVFQPSVLPGQGGVLEHALADLAEAGELNAYLHSGYWQTMDTLREKQELEAAWQKGDAPWTKHWKKT